MTTDAAGSFERVRELIRAQLVEQALPSLAVAVAREGTIVWEEGFGWADRERQIPATPQTLYSLALVREIHEESGYHARVGRLVGVYAAPFKDDLVLMMSATISASDGWKPNEEIAQIGFFAPDALPEPMSPRVHCASEYGQPTDRRAVCYNKSRSETLRFAFFAL